MRLFRSLIAVGLAGFLAMAAPAARADGLAQFQSLIAAKAKPGTLSYGSAAAVGASGFTLGDVVLTPPPGAGPPMPVEPGPIKVSRLTVESIDFDSIAKDQPPNFLNARLEGVSFAPQTTAQVQKYLGGDLPPADVVLQYKFDAARQTFALDRFELHLRGLARLELTLGLDGVTPDVVGPKAMEKVSLRAAVLVFDDTALVARVMAAVAAEQKINPAQQIELAAVFLAGFAEGQGPLTKALVEPLTAFVRNWERPKGALRISLKPADKVTADAIFSKMASADDVIAALGLSVSYAGSPAAPAPGSAPAKLTGLAAWNKLVGNTVSGRVDGKELVDYYRSDGTVKSLADSELSTGTWQLEGEQICFKYPDDDKACYTIELVGKTVTFTDKQGNGMRLELLEGNPRNL